MGLDLERVGSESMFVPLCGSVADESGFPSRTSLDSQSDVQHKDGRAATKRRKAVLDAFIGLSASLDSPSYF